MGTSVRLVRLVGETLHTCPMHHSRRGPKSHPAGRQGLRQVDARAPAHVTRDTRRCSPPSTALRWNYGQSPPAPSLRPARRGRANRIRMPV